jgi:DNA polymerase-3 subunit gamma/tau
MATKRQPRAWMFSGITGTGKTTIARIIAKSLQCTHSNVFGEPCKACRASTSFDIAEVNAAELNGVDAIKELAQHSTYFPSPGSQAKVIILDEAQRITKPAQNILLKYFEEPPKTTTWIVCTTEPDQILRTLRGRCYQLQVRPLRGKLAEAFIKEAAAKAMFDELSRETSSAVRDEVLGQARHTNIYAPTKRMSFPSFLGG